MAVKFAPNEKRLEEFEYLAYTHYVDDKDGLLYLVNRDVDRKGMIATNRPMVTAGMMGVEDKTPIHIADVERMTKGVDSGDRSKSGDIRDGSSPEPLEPNRESLGHAVYASIPEEGLPVKQEP